MVNWKNHQKTINQKIKNKFLTLKFWIWLDSGFPITHVKFQHQFMVGGLRNHQKTIDKKIKNKLLPLKFWIWLDSGFPILHVKFQHQFMILDLKNHQKISMKNHKHVEIGQLIFSQLFFGDFLNFVHKLVLKFYIWLFFSLMYVHDMDKWTLSFTKNPNLYDVPILSSFF